MRLTTPCELQDHAGPQAVRFHALSPAGAPWSPGASRSWNGPLYASRRPAHQGLSLRPSGGSPRHFRSFQGYGIGLPSCTSTRSRAISSRSFTAAHTCTSRSMFGSFSVGPSRKAADLGASEFVGGAGRTQQKGELICTQHALSFPFVQLVSQPVSRLDFAMGATPSTSTTP